VEIVFFANKYGVEFVFSTTKDIVEIVLFTTKDCVEVVFFTTKDGARAKLRSATKIMYTQHVLYEKESKSQCRDCGRLVSCLPVQKEHARVPEPPCFGVER
jgi:hypothetical protein